MAVLNFMRRADPDAEARKALADLLVDFSVEMMPRTADRLDDARELMPQGSRVYLAHIDGTPIDDMVRTAARLNRDGYTVMPHFPARLIPDLATLNDWIARYQGEADVRQALVLAGGVASPLGAFDNAMQLLETGAFDRAGFTRLHVAGHPEGNRDIDPDGSDRAVMQALHWKQAFAARTDAQMALVTQFCFDPAPVIAWADRLTAEGINLPIHIGVAGPAKLQTLIRFAVTCGVGPSVRVLTRRARDVTKLVRPFTPDAFLTTLALHKAAHPDFAIERVHLFPLGGIAAATDWARAQSQPPEIS